MHFVSMEADTSYTLVSETIPSLQNFGTESVTSV